LRIVGDEGGASLEIADVEVLGDDDDDDDATVAIRVAAGCDTAPTAVSSASPNTGGSSSMAISTSVVEIAPAESSVFGKDMRWVADRRARGRGSSD